MGTKELYIEVTTVIIHGAKNTIKTERRQTKEMTVQFIIRYLKLKKITGNEMPLLWDMFLRTMEAHSKV